MCKDRLRGAPPFERQRAFTLIEVLVVVAIIALLAAILLPTLAKARQQTRRRVCSSNLHQIGAALQEYQHTFKVFPHQARVGVPGAEVGSAGGNVIGAWPASVHRVIGKYVGMSSTIRPNEVFYCPSVSKSDRGSADIDREEPAGALGNPESYLHITYFYYGRLNTGNANNDPAQPRGGSSGESTREDVPSRRKWYATKDPNPRHVIMADAVSLWTGDKQWRVNHGPDYSPYVEGKAPRLQGQNVCYADGHVEWHRPDDFPVELRSEVEFQDLAKSALLLQSSDLHWW